MMIKERRNKKTERERGKRTTKKEAKIEPETEEEWLTRGPVWLQLLWRIEMRRRVTRRTKWWGRRGGWAEREKQFRPVSLPVFLLTHTCCSHCCDGFAVRRRVTQRTGGWWEEWREGREQREREKPTGKQETISVCLFVSEWSSQTCCCPSCCDGFAVGRRFRRRTGGGWRGRWCGPTSGSRGMRRDSRGGTRRTKRGKKKQRETRIMHQQLFVFSFVALTADIEQKNMMRWGGWRRWGWRGGGVTSGSRGMRRNSRGGTKRTNRQKRRENKEAKITSPQFQFSHLLPCMNKQQQTHPSILFPLLPLLCQSLTLDYLRLRCSSSSPSLEAFNRLDNRLEVILRLFTPPLPFSIIIISFLITFCSFGLHLRLHWKISKDLTVDPKSFLYLEASMNWQKEMMDDEGNKLHLDHHPKLLMD